MQRPHHFFWALAASLLLTSLYGESSTATELTRLSKENWSEFKLNGKEADAIYGDFVLRNETLSMVLGTPLPTRNANMFVKRVGGCIVDIGPRVKPNDQLTSYFPLGGQYVYEDPAKVTIHVDGKETELGPGEVLNGQQISITFRSQAKSNGTFAETTYTVEEGADRVLVETTVHNQTEKSVNLTLRDSMRADRTFQFGVNESKNLFWAYDEWFRACYGIISSEYPLQRGKSGVSIEYLNGDAPTATIAANDTLTLSRAFIATENSLQAKSVARNGSDSPDATVKLITLDPAGPVRNARIIIAAGETEMGIARTNGEGVVEFGLPVGEYQVSVTGLGRPPLETTIKIDADTEKEISLEACGYVRMKVTDPAGNDIPCKVSFYGEGETPDPFFGPDSKPIAVHNTRYTATGRFRQEIAPGQYQVVISRGPEYDAVVELITVEPGQVSRVNAELARVVVTPGWISTEYHSHSSPSGDNSSSQMGRVLNFLAEQIEFAPCTEHGRIASYMPHIRKLEATQWLATCSGMELTGSVLPVNHQNAFPLRQRFRMQDGGAPATDIDPVVQIERLAMMDRGSEKLVQSNHPNLIQIYGDKDNDRVPDGGFREMFSYMDVIEVHPPSRIFDRPTEYPNADDRGNAIFCWMQLLNLGYRIPGVVNTDAHYNFHGSGWLRNYVKSSTDAPAEIDVAEMVDHSEKGHVIMTNGPYLEVQLIKPDSDKAFISGDDVELPGGSAKLHVRVQCPNWLDVNRVQVFVNGTMPEELNFTRRTHAEWFSNEVVKFDRTIPIELEKDAHIIVAVAGEGLQLGRVMGESRGKQMPVAVANPIFVDVDGGGFQANGDLLGAPFPISASR